jgi:hypothetical protein
MKTVVITILTLILCSCSTNNNNNNMGLFDKLFGKKQTENKVQPSFSADTLTDNEKQLCKNAKLSEEDGLLLKKLTQRPIELLKFEQEYSEIEKPYAISSLTSEEKAKKIVLDNLDYFKKQGKYIFIFGIAHNGYIIGLTGATSDPYKLMELAETNGINYDIETKHILEKYKKWESEFGIIPIGIGFDFCECKIKNTNIDFKKLAQEVYEFCPDVVDQGTETVEALEEEMKRTGTIYLWWD